MRGRGDTVKKLRVSVMIQRGEAVCATTSGVLIEGEKFLTLSEEMGRSSFTKRSSFTSQETGISLPRNWKCCSWRGWCWCYENIGSSVTYWGGIWLRMLQIKTLVCWQGFDATAVASVAHLLAILDCRVRDTVGDHCDDEVHLLRLWCTLCSHLAIGV